MDYDPMQMDDAEAVGPVVKISQVCFCRNSHRLPVSASEGRDVV
jgi:hypothetical protein